MSFYSKMKSDLLFILEHAKTLRIGFKLTLENGAEGNETQEPLITHIFNT